MAFVICTIKASSLPAKARSEYGSEGAAYVIEDIRNLIIDKMNDIAEVVKEAYQTMVPIHTSALKNSIYVKKATAQQAIAEVLIADNAHWSRTGPSHGPGREHERQSSQLAAAAKWLPASRHSNRVTQTQLENVRAKARDEYDQSWHMEMHQRHLADARLMQGLADSNRAAGAQAFFARKRERIKMNAGAYALSNIELAFLLETGGKVIKKTRVPGQIVQHVEQVAPTRTFYQFGVEPMSEKEAFSSLEEKFHGSKGGSLKHRVETEMFNRFIAKRKQLDSEFDRFKKKITKIVKQRTEKFQEEYKEYERVKKEYNIAMGKMQIYEKYLKTNRRPQYAGMPGEEFRAEVKKQLGVEMHPSESTDYLGVKTKLAKATEAYAPYGLELRVRPYYKEYYHSDKLEKFWKDRKHKIESADSQLYAALHHKQEKQFEELTEYVGKYKEIQRDIEKEIIKPYTHPDATKHADRRIERRTRSVEERQGPGHGPTKPGHAQESGAHSYYLRSQTNPGVLLFTGQGGQKGTPTEYWMEHAQNIAAPRLEEIMAEIVEELSPKISQAVNASFRDIQGETERWLNTSIRTGIKPARPAR